MIHFTKHTNMHNKMNTQAHTDINTRQKGTTAFSFLADLYLSIITTCIYGDTSVTFSSLLVPNLMHMFGRMKST